MRPIQSEHELYSFVTGMLLGDASLSARVASRKASIQCTHSSRQAAYLDWKVDMLFEYVKPVTHKDINNHGYPARYAYFGAHGLFFNLWQEMYADNRKCVTWNVLNKLTPLGLAVWYMDDGSLVLRGKNRGTIKSREVHFSTHAYTESENRLIIEYFHNIWGVDFRLTSEKGHPRIWCNTQNTRRLLNIIGDIVTQVPGMQYKADLKYVRGPYINRAPDGTD